ncbi:MAG TPA: SHOCT domain-containing protein [Candidatus Methanoperedens sp.]
MNNKESTLWILVALLVAVVLLFSGSGMMGLSMGFGMGFGFIMMVLFWGAIIWLAISLINAGTQKSEGTPLAILKKRYARDEVTKEQYLEMEKELKG